MDDRPMDNLAYLTQGVVQALTQSSVLVSSSPLLNSAPLRDWLATHYLRRNGADRPVSSDPAGLIPILADLADQARIDALIEREREINPRFRAWVDEAYIAPHSAAFFSGYGPGTFGGIYHRNIVVDGFQPNLAREMITPRTAYEFMRFRFGQIHDFEHIISGGGFNTLGELLPYFVRLANVHRHLSPELAGELTRFHVLGGFRMPVRAGLHYPQVFLTVLDLLQRGIRIGLESEPIFMARFEDHLHLTPAEARVAMGVRHAEDVDTAAASRLFDDRG